MATLRINIINPKAKKLLKDLEDSGFISIEKEDKNDLATLLSKLRRNSKDAPSLEEITQEVELVRAERFAKENA